MNAYRDTSSNTSSRKACLWILGGCGCIVLLGILVLGGFSFWAYQAAEDFAETMSDPDAREAQALNVLGSPRLPDGYRAEIGMSIPFFADVVVLTDRPEEEEGAAEDRPDLEVNLDDSNSGAFIFFRYKQLMTMLSGGQELQDMKDFFEGRSNDLSSLDDAGINVDIDEVIRRDTLNLDSGDVLYVVGTGESDMTSGGPANALITLLLFDCAPDEVPPMGIWLGQNPEAAVPGEEVPDYAGTVADPERIRAFLEPLELCD
ncbi:MAG: hypothetical protein AAGD01_04000 [Acidobacteriota bacterium]